MNRQQWKDKLFHEARTGYDLERIVNRFMFLFDAEDRKILRLIRPGEWEQVWYGVRQELRSERGLTFDPQAPCFDGKRTIFHPIRRILMPGTLMAATRAAKNPNKVVTV